MRHMKDKVEVRFLGGAREVGRSAILMSYRNTRLLLDYGVLVGDGKPELPIHVPPRDIDAIIVTHAHLDHSGAVPFFYISCTPPLYTTSLTKQLSDILIRDLLNLSHYYLPFEVLELVTMLDNTRKVKAEKTVKVKDATITFFRAGHIPGSLSVLVEIGGRYIWYSGDINTIDTRLLTGASLEGLPEVDLAIIESTYALTDHPDRMENERKLIEVLSDVVDGGGLALVPAFSVGRSQEILCILEAHGFEYPVAVDGMARIASKILIQHPKEIRDPELLRRAVKKAHFVTGGKDREKVRKRPGVVVSPAGMLTGGAAAYYMEKVAKNPKDAVILVSYQIPGTPGRRLLDEGRYELKGKPVKVKCRVEWLDFSSHCGRKELHELVKSLKGSPTVVTVHGEAEACKEFAAWIRDEVGFKAMAAKLGEKVVL
ncbi:MAG: MBL fold metallo-hydrolase [Candidatus Verstraetearchaeota archaeon]|nr:MBL fold metallo-hydrolase [Candidatus Verstraetearchaeota archaeon]